MNSYVGTLQCRITLSECYDIEYFALITGEGPDTVYVRNQYTGECMVFHIHVSEMCVN